MKTKSSHVKKALTLIFTTVAFFIARSQDETILLFTEDFDNGTNSIIFDDPAGPGANTGNNDWIVNNSYDGQSVYPNTPSQDSTTAGLIINNAPFSNYLHIHNVDAESVGISNDNWDINNASDRFCYIGNSFCTLGLTHVQFTFDWICEGKSSAYGQVYYRSAMGPWIQIGQPKYFNQGKWAYESIQDPQLDNQQDIQIGFRWINPRVTGNNSIAFGIDDVFAVGTYNSADTTGAVTISASAYHAQICQGDPVLFHIGLSNPLCDGLYKVELSDANGSFRNPYNIGVLSADPSFTGGYYNSLPTDGSLKGNCFKIRILRISPAPFITSDTSLCFSIVECPNAIFNVNAPVMNDGDTTCIQSEIDVKFNSIGVFKAGNKYYAELSDTDGNFADSTLLGTLPVRDSFPSIPPGNISGVIPASVPPGCGYYIRVRSTNPPTVSTPKGPYCLVHCDELTNKIEDLHFCVASGPYPVCDSINIAPNHWDNQAKYDTCNKWLIELRSMKDFSPVNIGGLAIYHDNVGGNFQLCMPPSAALLPVAPGAYYMRMVSTCSNQPWNQTGTVIRITIGAPGAVPSNITLSDSEICAGGSVSFSVSPFKHPPSDYEWTSSLLDAGVPFIWPYSGFTVTTLPFTPLGTYVTTVREINFGCFGPYSPPAYLTITGTPGTDISGPTLVCLGDTAHYDVTFLKKTYYLWTASPGVQVLDKSNVRTSIVFDSLGTFELSNFALNYCGSYNVSIQVTVIPPPFSLDARPDTSICIGDSVTIDANAINKGVAFMVLDTGNSAKQGGMFNLIAHSDVTIDSFAVKLKTHPQFMKAEIYGKPGSYLSYEKTPAAWKLLAKNYNNPTAPTGEFSVIDAPVSQFIPAGDTFAFYVTTINSPALNIGYGTGNNIQEKFFNTDGNIDFIQGTVLDYSFTNNIPVSGYVLNVKIYYSTKAGLHYTWSNGETSGSFRIAPNHDEDFSVLVTSHGQCSRWDTLHIKVLPIPTVSAGPDTAVCPDLPYIMLGASSSPVVVWQPSTGLSSVSDPQAIFNYGDSVSFVLTAIDTASHCMNRDSVKILVPLKLSVGPGAIICQGTTDTLHASSTGEHIAWSPSFGLNDSTVLDPVFSSTSGTGGEFTITATDKNGCKLSGKVKVEVLPCTLHVSQAFTPNGDGLNDHFTVFVDDVAAVSEYEIRIFNRWGEMVYHSTEVNDLNHLDKGWDGTFKGKLQDTGTFVYYITVTDPNGKTADKKGNITLIR